MTKRLCSNIFLSLYLYRNDASTLLDKEIQFSIAMLAAPIIYEYIRHRYHLLQNLHTLFFPYPYNISN